MTAAVVGAKHRAPRVRSTHYVAPAGPTWQQDLLTLAMVLPLGVMFVLVATGVL